MAIGRKVLARLAPKRFRRDDSGVAAIEFALVGGPFLFLTLAVFETGIMLFAEYIIENGTAQAARLIRTGQVQSQGLSKAQFKNLVCGEMADFLDCANKLSVDVRKFPDFASVSLPPAVDANGNLNSSVTSGSQWQPGAPLEVVVVRTYYAWELFTPGASKLSDMANGRRLLSGGAAFRNEPFPTD